MSILTLMEAALLYTCWRHKESSDVMRMVCGAHCMEECNGVICKAQAVLLRMPEMKPIVFQGS